METSNQHCNICGQKVWSIEDSDLRLCADCQKGLRKSYEDIFSYQPSQNRKIDQFAMDFKSIVSQLVFMKESIKGKTIAFFGGYDGTGLLSMFFGAKSTILWDIDCEVLRWWRKIGMDYNFDVSIVLYDAREPITNKVIEPLRSYTAEAWRTDPPYNCAGMFCFISRITYMNENHAPLFLCVPTGYSWSKLLKHNLWQYLRNNRMRVIDVSHVLCSYTDVEGPDSAVYKIKMDAAKLQIPNERFIYNIYTATPEFANSYLGCGQYELCRASRNELNEEPKNKLMKKDMKK